MKRYFRGRLRSLRHGDSGFTLVELLVVVGIIVALAAVIIPNVASFANRGDTGAQNAEEDNIQAAMDTMMADKSITAVTASVAGAATSDFATLPDPAGNELFPSTGTQYLRSGTTVYFYCWDATGLITQFIATSGGDCP